MMYYGYFRSIDTSVDPKGQQYKVEIITNFGEGDGYDYLYNGYSGDRDIPSEGTELTMCEHPFEVQYEGEQGNVYKPYKCSTATVRFMLPSFNPNLFSTGSRRVMVALLKRNNDVQLIDGRYVDTANGHRDCGIRLKSIQTGESESWTGYTYKDLDRVLYTVEWIGFVTPNAYNQPYIAVRGEFELECQDALSTLKYSRTMENDNYQSFLEIIQAAVLKLGVYNHLYFSTAIYVPDTDLTSSLRRLIVSPQNFYHADEMNYDDMLTILAELMTVAGCTMTAYGDSLYVLQYDAIAGNHNRYYHYQLVKSSRSYFGMPGEGYYNSVGTVLRQSSIALCADSFKGSDTNVSVASVVNKLTLTTAENVPDTLLPDMTNGELMIVKKVSGPHDQWAELGGGQKRSRCVGGVLSAMDCGVKNLLYRNSNWSECSFTQFSNPLLGTFCEDYSGSAIVNGGKFESEIDGEHTLSERRTGVWLWCSLNSSGYDSRPLFRMSATFVRKRADGIRLRGNVAWYQTLHPVSNSEVDGAEPALTQSNCYMRARVKIVTYSGRTLYFQNGTNLQSTNWSSNLWSSTPQICKLPLYDTDSFDDVKFGHSRSFQNTDGDGLIIPLPQDITGSDDIMTVTVEFFRHLAIEDGGSQVWSMFIDNLRLDTCGTENLSVEPKLDTSMVVTATEGDIVAEEELSARLSTFYLNNSKGYVFETYLDGLYWQLRNLTNMATGICNSPEVHRIANLYNQYSDAHPTIGSTLRYSLGVRPWTRVTWPTQFAGKVFVVDSLSIDFEYDEVHADILDKEVSNSLPAIKVKLLDSDTGIVMMEDDYPPTVGPWGDGWRGYYYRGRNDLYDPPDIISYINLGTLDESIDKRSEACVRFEPVFEDDGVYASVTVPTENVELTIDENGYLILTQYAY